MSRKFIPVLCGSLIALILGQLTIRPANADGGIITSDPEIWAGIEEGQQIAVIQLHEDNTAQVDLFITMLDRSGRSHQVVFFIPLGVAASDFNVIEQTSLDFDKALTEQLDERISEYGEREASYKTSVQSSLLLGTLMTNGLWSLLIVGLLSSCAPAAVPIATFQTESSYISIYEMDEQMDVQALIETTGLNPSVKETLEDLSGQQIAVIELQTQPKSETSDWTYDYEVKGQPGIHLTWTTNLVSHSVQASYTYPLGTGRAWASPIELTRIYVVAAKGIDFSVESPKLGADLSGMEGTSWLGLAGRISYKIDQAKSPAFAVDNSYGSYGRIWRGTYVKSNSDRDILIVKTPETTPETRSAIRQSQAHQSVLAVTWVISLVLGALIWVGSWWLVMTRLAKVPYRWREGRLWSDAFAWSLIYPAVTIAMLVVAGLVTLGVIIPVLAIEAFSQFLERIIDSQMGEMTLLFLIGLPVWVAIVGLVNAFLFARLKAVKLNITKLRAFGAYLLVILMANGMYLIFSVGYAALVGGI